MSHNPLSDVVTDQYSKWMYPSPIFDLDNWLLNNWQWFDPIHSSKIFWPDREYFDDMDILIAGCGTNQAAVIAYNNPSAHVTAIDVSQPSLDHHLYLKDKYGISNINLILMPIEKIRSLNKKYDLIISTGVLHHMKSPEKGMAALASCLRPEGVAALMLYATYGRIGVEMLQAVFRDIGLEQDEDSLSVVKKVIFDLPNDHPLKSYLAIAPDLQYDAGLVDTFLHGRDRSYTINGCKELVESAGLIFQDIFFKAPYYPVGGQFGCEAAIARLPIEKQWSVMERINHRNACHFFFACRKERPQERYRIDFQSSQAPAYVPAFRYRCGIDGTDLVRPNWKMQMSSEQAQVVTKINGVSTIADIQKQTGVSATKDICERLWKQDFINILLRD